MKKSLMLFAAGMSFLTCINSNSAQASFYVGGSVGYQPTMVNNQRKLLIGDSTQRTSKISDNGGMGSFYFGYGTNDTKSQLYLGLEVSIGLSSLNAKNTDGLEVITTTTEAKLRDSYGLALKPGVVFNNVVGYLKLGGTLSNWQFKSGLALTDVAAITVKKYTPGFEIGLGMEAPLNQKLKVGVECSAIFFRKTSLSNFNIAGREISRLKISPQTNNLTLRLTYKI